ncbi:MAG: tetratricopeptide repeat protein, partial [Boseongicola sp.]|nr:tetratricopeptide repeat protein [Boseongicola sp.]
SGVRQTPEYAHCRLNEFSLEDSGFELLIRLLTAQASVEKNELGAIPNFPTKRPSGNAHLPKGLNRPIDISRIVKYAPLKLIGREQETALLDSALDQMTRGTRARPRVLTFVALGGEGKTSLVAKWVDDLDQKGWPGCEIAFAWSFYSQGSRDQAAVSSDLFLTKALEFFGDPDTAVSAQGAYEKGQRLAALVGARKSILVLYGLEPLQFPPSSPTPGKLKDQGIEALLSGLTRHSNGLCVVTTRFEIADVRSWPDTAPQHELLRLSKQAGVYLLRSIRGGTKLKPTKIEGTPEEFEALVEDVDGHALTLQIIGQYLVRAHHGDIRRRDRIDFAIAETKTPGGPKFRANHAFRAIAAYEEWLGADSEESRRGLAVLRILGLFDRPATADCVEALLKKPAIGGLTEPLVDSKEEDWELTLTTLSDARLVSVNREEGTDELLSLDAHPLIREYFSQQLQGKEPDAWQTAHRRLYEHLCATTKESDQPSLGDLQPLYQAVAHGCKAGLQQKACDDVYFARILRGQETYATRRLGAYGSDLGAVACFFETPWSRVSSALDEEYQAWQLNSAAICLRALGRLPEAIEPMREAQAIYVKQKKWMYVAICCNNLSELESTLGELTRAVTEAEKAVSNADSCGDAHHRATKRCSHADALHQAGRPAEAELLFKAAEQIHAENQPVYPLMYSIPGIQYCDLLLPPTEREAWRATHSVKSQRSSLNISEVCHAATERTCKILKIAESQNWLLDIALGHLILARTELYESILCAKE